MTDFEQQTKDQLVDDLAVMVWANPLGKYEREFKGLSHFQIGAWLRERLIETTETPLVVWDLDLPVLNREQQIAVAFPKGVGPMPIVELFVDGALVLPSYSIVDGVLSFSMGPTEEDRGHSVRLRLVGQR